MGKEQEVNKATELVEKLYAGGQKNVESVQDELFAMPTHERQRMIKLMLKTDELDHKDPSLKDKHLPHIQISDRETAHGHQLQIRTFADKGENKKT